MSETWTTLRVLDWTTGRFERGGIDSARLDAQVLLAHVLSCDRVTLYTIFDQPLGPDELAGFRALIKRRLDGEPVAYLVSEQEFWSLPFHVDERVLIPRADTETLIEVVLDETEDRTRPLRVADVATGSGAIAITLARELANASVVATDLSDAALEVAAANARRNEVSDRVGLRRGDLLAPLGDDRFHVLAANLPYVPTGDIEGLSPEVQHEPRAALDGGAEGLDLIRQLVAGSHRHLEPGGLLVLEHGSDQAEAVAAMIRDADRFDEPSLRRDLGKRNRITYARRRA